MKRILLHNFCFSAAKRYTDQSILRHGSTHHYWPLGDGKTPKKLKIAMWNVNGIRSITNKGKLTQFIKIYDPDIISFNQTKIDLKAYLKQAEKIKDFLPNYYQSWNFSKISSGYSGVSVFTKYKPICYQEDIPEQIQHNFEGRSLTLQFQEFFLISCYKPNSGSQLQRLAYRVNEYDKAFEKYLEKLKKRKPIIACGDFNVAHKQIDIRNPQANRQKAGFTIQQRQSFSKLLDIGLVDSFRYLHPQKIQYTYWSYQANSRARNIGWRIDYILVDNRLKIKQAYIFDKIEGSDHCPISALIQIL